MGDIFDRLGLTPADLAAAVEASPSLRGMFVGYLAERKFAEMWLPKLAPRKPDDHDRTKKGDRWITYKGHEISIEVKSLQTNSVKDLGDGKWKGSFQCDASDCRKVTLPNGGELETTCLVVGGFDLLAVNLFEFGQHWRFAFVRNGDLPRSRFTKYTSYQREYLLQTTPPITWPLQPPYKSEPFQLLDAIVQERASRRR